MLHSDGASPSALPLSSSDTDRLVLQLLIIEALQATANPEHVDVAEELQNKLYYEADTLDMTLSLIHKFNGQSYRFVLLALSFLSLPFCLVLSPPWREGERED